MKRVKKNNQEFQIDCENEMCGNCNYKPQSISELKCKLFDVFLDHENKGIVDNSSWKRCYECINAEIT